ncbi:MAG: type 4 prepilin-like proteins leader peptide-processing enzyme [Gemmatimonadales bacterium]|nr:MAG: type 4 prepilin-like proteins leader peptide-processing enzyme [Gemmatimonadales bacterium]
MFEVLPAALLGSVIGSFLNVLIVRLPRDQSIVSPRSRCPKCGRSIAWYDNIPILSWLLLRGRCRHCGQSISVQYPLVEGAVALLWGGAAWYYGPGLTALTAAIFGTLLLGIAVTDARHYLIPDEYTWGGLVLGLALAWRNGLPGFWQAILGAGVGFGLLYFIAWAGERVFKEEAMGGGDIKMMAMVGSYIGWQGVLLTLFGGALLGTLVFVPLSLKRRRLVPFGVFLAAAAAFSFVWKDALLGWYAGFLSGPR